MGKRPAMGTLTEYCSSHRGNLAFKWLYATG